MTTASTRHPSKGSASAAERCAPLALLALLALLACTAAPTAGDTASSAVAATTTAPDPLASDPDADIVLVFPAEDEAEYLTLWDAMADWIALRTDQGYTVAGLPLYEIGAESSAEELREALGERFSDRRATESERGRYLGLLSIYDTGADPDAVYAPIPRHRPWLEASGGEEETDVLYGYPHEDADWSDGAALEAGSFDFSSPTFHVFRVPVTEAADLSRFAERGPAFEIAESRRDILLVAGQITALAGDSASLQCAIATQLDEVAGVGEVLKVFDADICEPDYLVTGPEHRLPHFLSAPETPWRGGTLFNTSHGNGTAIYYGTDDGFQANLSVSDADLIPEQPLNIFVALSCSVDESLPGMWNLNRLMYEKGSVATATATANTWAEGLEDVQIGQLDALPRWLEGDQPIAQALHGIRRDYYEQVVLDTEDPKSTALFWRNLVAFGVTGDGLVGVGL